MYKTWSHKKNGFVISKTERFLCQKKCSKKANMILGIAITLIDFMNHSKKFLDRLFFDQVVSWAAMYTSGISKKKFFKQNRFFFLFEVVR